MIPLFPKQEDFFTLFKRQSAMVRQGCGMLHDMMENFDHLEDRARKLKEVEHNADLVTHEIFARLNRSFVTPLDREDIHALASGLDDVLDSAEAIASRLLLFKIPHSTSEARQLTAILDQCRCVDLSSIGAAHGRSPVSPIAARFGGDVQPRAWLERCAEDGGHHYSAALFHRQVDG